MIWRCFFMIKSIGKNGAFFAGMAKAFDFYNSQLVFKRRKTQTIRKFYGEEKTDTERLAEDWVTVGKDMSIAMTKFGEQYGK